VAIVVYLVRRRLQDRRRSPVAGMLHA